MTNTGIPLFRRTAITTLQIRAKGTITLPASLRKKYGLEEGAMLTVIDMGEGTFMLTPKTSKVMESADKVARIVKDANVTLEDLLETLDDERKIYYREHYAKE